MNNKNILYLTRTMGLGGTEKVILQLCEGLEDQFNKIIVVSRGGIHEKWLNENGIKHYSIDDFENKNPKIILKTLVKLIRIVKEENIGIIHSHHRMGTLYAKIVSKFIKCKIIHTAHNTFYDKKRITKLVFKDINLIAVGHQVKNNITDFYGINEKAVQVIYNGMKKSSNFINLPIEPLVELKQKGFYLVGNIGRLSEQKGMEYFINAIPKIVKVESKIKFIIIGDGELKNDLIKLVEKLNIKSKVMFLGYRDDIPNVIDHLDLIVLSSLWEGLPLTPIETFMQGKTIIATKVDGTSEIVTDNVNGVLVKPKNSNEITEAVLRIYMNGSLKEKMEKEALQTYFDKFTYERFIEGYKKYYLNINKTI